MLRFQEDDRTGFDTFRVSVGQTPNTRTEVATRSGVGPTSVTINLFRTVSFFEEGMESRKSRLHQSA